MRNCASGILEIPASLVHSRPELTGVADNWARRDLNGWVERDNQTELFHLLPGSGSKDRFPWRATRLL